MLPQNELSDGNVQLMTPYLSASIKYSPRKDTTKTILFYIKPNNFHLMDLHNDRN